MAVDLKDHPGLNPDYFQAMKKRRAAMQANKLAKAAALGMGIDPRQIRMTPVPKQPNKYVPHIGAKQRAKGVK